MEDHGVAYAIWNKIFIPVLTRMDKGLDNYFTEKMQYVDA